MPIQMKLVIAKKRNEERYMHFLIPLNAAEKLINERVLTKDKWLLIYTHFVGLTVADNWSEKIRAVMRAADAQKEEAARDRIPVDPTVLFLEFDFKNRRIQQFEALPA
jgi:hypothetical protein